MLSDDERLLNRVLITQRQMGNVSGSISYLVRTPKTESAKISMLIDHIECDLGDLLLQTKMLIKDMGYNEDHVLKLAYDRYDETKEEFARRGKSQYFI